MESYKTLMKEIKGDTNMEKYNKTVAQKNQYSENEYTNQTIYRFNAILMKPTQVFFTELGQISQFVWEHKKP